MSDWNPNGAITPRESQTWAFIATGMLTKEIAHEMGISEATVKVNISSLLHKLKVTSRTHAALMWHGADVDMALSVARSGPPAERKLEAAQ